MVDSEMHPEARRRLRVISSDKEAAISRRVTVELAFDELVDSLHRVKTHSRDAAALTIATLGVLATLSHRYTPAQAQELDAPQTISETHRVFMPIVGREADYFRLPKPGVPPPTAERTQVPPSSTPTATATEKPSPSPEPTKIPETEVSFPASLAIAYNASRDVLAEPGSFSSYALEPKGKPLGPGTGWILDSSNNPVAYRFLHQNGGYFEVTLSDIRTFMNPDTLPGDYHVYSGNRDDIKGTLLQETYLLPQDLAGKAAQGGIDISAPSAAEAITATLQITTTPQELDVPTDGGEPAKIPVGTITDPVIMTTVEGGLPFIDNPAMAAYLASLADSDYRAILDSPDQDTPQSRLVGASKVPSLPSHDIKAFSPLTDRVEAPEGAPLTFQFSLDNSQKRGIAIGYWLLGKGSMNMVAALAFDSRVFIFENTGTGVDGYYQIEASTLDRSLSGTITLSAPRDTATWTFTDSVGEEVEFMQRLAHPLVDNNNIGVHLYHQTSDAEVKGEVTYSFPADPDRFTDLNGSDAHSRDLARVNTLLSETESLRGSHRNIIMPDLGYEAFGSNSVISLSPRADQLTKKHAVGTLIDPASSYGSFGEGYIPGTDAMFAMVTRAPYLRPLKNGEMQRVTEDDYLIYFVLNLALGKKDITVPIPNETSGPELLDYIGKWHEGSSLSPNLIPAPAGFFDPTGLLGSALRRIDANPRLALQKVADRIGHRWNIMPIADRGFIPGQTQIDALERTLDQIQDGPVDFNSIVVSAVAPGNMSAADYLRNLTTLRNRLAARQLGLGVQDVGCGAMSIADAIALTRGVASFDAPLILCNPRDKLFDGKRSNSLFDITRLSDDPLRAFRFRSTPELSNLIDGL